MSTRQSREELIKKGVLKEVHEKGERSKVKGEYVDEIAFRWSSG